MSKRGGIPLEHVQGESYDDLRERNIARNTAMLASLGFTPAPKYDITNRADPARKNSKRKEDFSIQTSGIRSSKRLRGMKGFAVDSTSELVKKPVAYYSEQSMHSMARNALFNEPPVLKKPSITWDSKRKHQHLELSSSKLTVATTGCAGYGAVVASATNELGVAKVAKKKCDSRPQTWTVEVIGEGTGGFSVGICKGNISKPYKSLGNRHDAWVLHSSGRIFHNRIEKETSNRNGRYNAGSLVTINISESGTLSYIINGILVDSSIVLCPGEYMLCCQPYMGGVARIANSD